MRFRVCGVSWVGVVMMGLWCMPFLTCARYGKGREMSSEWNGFLSPAGLLYAVWCVVPESGTCGYGQDHSSGPILAASPRIYIVSCLSNAPFFDLFLALFSRSFSGSLYLVRKRSTVHDVATTQAVLPH